MVAFTDEVMQRLFGAEDAENESSLRLKEFFFRNKAFEQLVSDLPIRVLVGHKGVGKSALLRVAYLQDIETNNLSLWLQPDDLRSKFPPKTASFLDRIRAWKEGLTELIFDKIVESLTGKPETSIGRTIQQSSSAIVDAISEWAATKLPTMVGTSKHRVVSRFLEKKKICIYLDDLDRGWEARPEDIQNISALLNAIRDICGSDAKLQFRLGLRSDVYYLVRTADESTDKIERNLIFLTWTNHEILTLLAKRIETFFGRQVDEKELITRKQSEIARYLSPVIEERFHGDGKWSNAPIHRVLLSLTRKRPRDLIKVFYGAGREAYKNGHEIISTNDLRSVFALYSNERIQDVINEFKSELPQVASLVRGMRPTTAEKKTSESGYIYSNDQLITKLKNLIRQNNFSFTSQAPATANALGQFLYKIDFITARKEDDRGVILRKYFDQHQFLRDQFVDFGFNWEIHPAYRWALQPDDPMRVFERTDLIGDENI